MIINPWFIACRVGWITMPCPHPDCRITAANDDIGKIFCMTKFTEIICITATETRWKYWNLLYLLVNTVVWMIISLFNWVLLIYYFCEKDVSALWQLGNPF